MRDKKKSNTLADFFLLEKKNLCIVTVTGILYNIGMAAGPWFEGQLAGTLADIIKENKTFTNMLALAVTYVVVIAFVQWMRMLKRLYVRKFANNTAKTMKNRLYEGLVGKADLGTEDTGSIMTKALSDVDDCVEGMRKFTTEVYDTGVVMVVYLTMLLIYDWKLSILVMIFPPLAYVLAGRLKKPVTAATAAMKESMGRLNNATLDRAGNALTFRVFGQEKNQNRIYEDYLQEYEKKSILAGLYTTALEPIYKVLSMAGVIFILYFGGKNVLGSGWSTWTIAAFSTYLACFTKLAVKSGHAAKLFNAVQKAKVSWVRIQPFLEETDGSAEQKEERDSSAGTLEVKNLSYGWKADEKLFKGLSFSARPGMIIGITGPVACGKSTVGRVLMGELRAGGELKRDGRIAYVGHDPQLFSLSIEDNIRMGRSGDLSRVLEDVCLTEDLMHIPGELSAIVGEDGTKVSGGQAQRIALARALFSGNKILVLDDPFSAVDKGTEEKIFRALRSRYTDRTIILISHRLQHFPQMDLVLHLADGYVSAGTHVQLLETDEGYRKLWKLDSTADGAGKAQVKQNNKPQSEQTVLQEKKKRMRVHPLLKSLAGVIRKSPATILLLVCAIAASVVLEILPPLVLAKAVDGLTSGTIALYALLMISAGYWAILILGGFASSGREAVITVFGQKVTHELRTLMAEKMLRLKSSYFTGNGEGELTSRMVSDVGTVESLFTSGIVSMVSDLAAVISIVIVIFTKNKGLGFLLLIALPILFLYTRKVQKSTLAAKKVSRKAVQKANGMLPETIRNLRIIRIYDAAPYMKERYGQAIEQGFQAAEKSNYYDAVYSPVILTIQAVLVAVMMTGSAYGSNLRSLFGMTTGTAVAVIALVGKVFSPLSDIGMEIQNIQSAAAGVSRIKEFFEEPEKGKRRNSDVMEGESAEAVEIRDVTFAYEDAEPLLRDYSLTVKSGEHVTLMGRTGAGKSTLMKLILGLYDPMYGEVRIDGHDVRQIAEEDKRSLYGYVEQKFHSILGSVGEQVSLKDETVTEEEIWKALETAGLKEHVAALPEGLDTDWKAAAFSQGETQLLSVARAVVKNPSLLLLDEVNATVDGQTARELYEALKKAAEGRTMISIAHRLAAGEEGRIEMIG